MSWASSRAFSAQLSSAQHSLSLRLLFYRLKIKPSLFYQAHLVWTQAKAQGCSKYVVPQKGFNCCSQWTHYLWAKLKLKLQSPKRPWAELELDSFVCVSQSSIKAKLARLIYNPTCYETVSLIGLKDHQSLLVFLSLHKWSHPKKIMGPCTWIVT